MKRIKLLLASIFLAPLLFSGAALAVAPAPDASVTEATDPSIQNSLCGGVELSVTQTDCDTTAGSADESINTLIATVINIFSLIVGVVAVIMIIIGGLKYITSGGDSGNVTGAKNTILYAVVGLVVVALAQIIVRFVLNRATNAGS